MNKDEDVNESIKREVYEELNVKIQEPKPFRVTSGKAVSIGQFIFVLFSSKIIDIKNQIKISNEHSKYKWIEFNEIEKYDFYFRESIVDDIRKYLKELK